MIIDFLSTDVLSTAFAAGLALSTVSQRESRSKLIRLFADTTAVQPSTPDLPRMDSVSELNFTRSLLALSKVGSLNRGGSPEPAPGESSSLVLVHRAQSKNPDPIL